MTSLARGLAVIRAFPHERRGMSIAQLSRRTGISRAAVRRCLYTLAMLGYVDADEQGFAPRPQVLSLGRTYLSTVAAAQPVLDQLSVATGGSCALAILAGEDIVVVGSSPIRNLLTDVRVGGRLPAHCTAMGRMLLAGMASGELARFLNALELAQLTDKALLARDWLVAAIERAGVQQFAAVDREFKPELCSIAVPVKVRRNSPDAALGINALATQVTMTRLEKRALPLLRNAAEELGAALGEGAILP